jgi:hypothetical protein
MTNRTDFFHETLSATTEILGGGTGAWVAKMTAGVIFALAQSVEAATIAIAVFLVLCILDAILGLMRQIKINRQPGSVNVPIKVWRLVSGPASKWLVGGVVLLAASFFDHVMFGADAWMGGPVLKFCSGIVLGAITIEVAAKADYLQSWGISDKLRKRFPEFFSHD